MIRRYAANPAHRSGIHRQLEERCGLSQSAALLLVELDMFGEVSIESDDHLPALMELRARGFADLASEPHACARVVPTACVRELMRPIIAIVALDAELARRARVREPAPAPHSTQDDPPAAPLSPELERAIVEDALALIDRSPLLPAASEVRVYLRTGPRYVRVFWTYRRHEDDSGSILHFVEKATGRIYQAKSARQVGRPTGRVLGGAHA